MDLLRLRDASIARLLDALGQPGPDPSHVGVVAALAVDETVRLVRGGSRSELVEGGEALARFLRDARGVSLQEAAPGAYDTLSGLLPVMTAASSPASRGGEQVVLRSWNGKAQTALAEIAAAGGQLARARLRDKLGVSESYLSHMLGDLEAANLVERVGGPGRRSVDVQITYGGRQLVELPAAPPLPRRPMRSVRRPRGARGGDLCRRLDAVSVHGGPSMGLRPSRGLQRRDAQPIRARDLANS